MFSTKFHYTFDPRKRYASSHNLLFSAGTSFVSRTKRFQGSTCIFCFHSY